MVEGGKNRLSNSFAMYLLPKALERRYCTYLIKGAGSGVKV